MQGTGVLIARILCRHDFVEKLVDKATVRMAGVNISNIVWA